MINGQIINEELHDDKEVKTQESLQPKRINPDEKAYQTVRDIKERLHKGDATNIALTGPYGSGKSSILITLKEDYPEHHYLNISLATLKPSDAIAKEKNGKGADENNEEELSKLNLDRLIEYSILQQLIYKEKQEVLPNSRFKRIFHLTSKRVCEITLAIILAVLDIIIIFEPSFLRVEWLCKVFGREWMNVVGDSLSIIYLLWFAYEAISMIVPAVSNSRLNKLNLKDGEIEIVENTSIFNKHLDEILYFFEKTDYDVVMLEDLDRFESIDIFLKLRELNLLLNESKVIERKIFFVYAVRDDMFQDAERVKCFDYITTVIPVINRSNAKNQLKEELQRRGVTEISDHHLQELGFFLYDMRLLKNIANEYVQYRGKLSAGISSEKLLGMIVYKNFYPQDFADLHDCKGMVYKLLNLKETFVAAKIEELEEENKRKRELQESHQKERHLKETELRRIYLEGYREQLISTMQHIRIGDSNYSIKDIAANEKLFEKLINNKSIKYTYIDTNGGYYGGQTRQASADISFENIEENIDSSKNYHERLDNLRTAIDGKKYDFIAAYYQKGCRQDVVFPLLFDQHKGQWSAWESKDDDKQSLKLSWFKYAEKEQSCEGSRKWLNEHFVFMADNLLDIDAEHWCTLIGNGEYQFEELNVVSRDILNAVADTNAYKLTRHNVEVLVGYLLEMDLDSVSYTLVNQTEHELLIERVEENLGQCIKTVFAAPESEKESVDAILGILLDAQVMEVEKIAYLKKQQNKIDLEQAEQKDIKTLALKCDVVEVSWENVVHYLNEVSEKKADTTLIAFVDKHSDELAMQGIDQLSSENVRNLLAQFIGTDDLGFESFTRIVGCFDRWYYEKGVPSIEERRAIVLNERGMLHYTVENTESFISHYSPSALMAYLLKHKREWLKKPEAVEYSAEAAVGLLRSSLTISEKASIIPCFDVSILTEELADEIMFILNKQEIMLNKDFLLKVMRLTNMPDERLRVMNYTLEKNVFDEDVITALIETLHLPYKYIAEKGKKPELPNNEESWRLVKVLKERDYISSYSETKKGIRVNTKLK